MFNTEKTKKVIIAVLFIVAVIGIVGYGVYSVEYETGTFVTEASITVGSFDPQTIVSDTASFLGDGGIASITCPPVTGDGTIICTGSMTIKNNGDGPIVVEVVEADEDDEYSKPKVSESSSDVFTGEASGIIYDWMTKTIGPKETVVLNISVPVQIVSNYNSAEQFEYSSEYPLEDKYETLEVTFSIRAYQYVGE